MKIPNETAWTKSSLQIHRRFRQTRFSETNFSRDMSLEFSARHSRVFARLRRIDTRPKKPKSLTLRNIPIPRAGMLADSVHFP